MGTAPEQKTKSAKSGLKTTFKPLFYKCIFYFISARASPCPTIRQKKFRVRMNFFEIHNKHFVPLSFSPPNF